MNARADITSEWIAKFMAPLIDVPRSKRGCFSVDHSIIPADHCLDVIDLRRAYLTGQSPCRVRMSAPRVVHKLAHDRNGVMMTDHPTEIWDMVPAAQALRGRVLVGGLGLGVILAMIKRFAPRVVSVVVVERERDVIDLIKPTISTTCPSVEIAHVDLFDYLDVCEPGEFDSAFFDIWYGTGEMTWAQHIVPLRRAVARNGLLKRDAPFFCWAEDQIIAQVRASLAQHATFKGAEHPWVSYAAFQRGMPKDIRATLVERPTDDGFKMLDVMQQRSRDPLLIAAVDHYVNSIGTRSWERRYGAHWDALTKGKQR